MNKIFLTLILFVFQSSFYYAQTFKVKEQFDFLQPQIHGINSYADFNTLPPAITNQGNLGDGISRIIDSYLTMYQVTDDKAYLIKFIQECILIERVRNDYTEQGAPKWTKPENNNTSEELYHNGCILMPMAKFVYIIKSNSSIYNAPLYQTSDLQSFSLHFPTYGSFATWLSNRVDESLFSLILNNWSTEGFMDHGNSVEIINKQSDLAASLLYMGLANNNSGYISKSITISNKYHSQVGFTDQCPTTISYNAPVFQQNNFNSYWWYLHGWRIPTRDCMSWEPPYYAFWDVPKLSVYVDAIEDMSHAVQTLVFPFSAYETGNHFSESEMIKFHNTFTKHLWHDSEFHNNVAGTDDHFWQNGIRMDDRPPGFFKYRALNYMPLWKFDGLTGSNNNVYYIIMPFYGSHVYEKSLSDMSQDGVVDFSSASLLWGISEVAKAQWQKESCLNLTLYNRDLVYNQNFSAKNKLIVTPMANDYYHTINQVAFAEPNFTSNEFIVRSGVSCTMTAGDIISLDDFEAEFGSEFEAISTGDICPAFRLANQNFASSGADKDASIKESNSIQTNQQILFTILPNPASENARFIYYVMEKSDVKITLYSVLGKEIALIQEQKEAGSFEINFDAVGLNPGVYFCNFNAKGLQNGKEYSETKKLVKISNQ